METKLVRLTTMQRNQNISKLYADVVLADFDTSTPARQKALNTVAEYTQYFAEGVGFYGDCDELPFGLYLTGAVGTGKTHLAIAAMREIETRGIECYFINVVQALHQLRPPDSDDELFDYLSTVPFLVLDDLGAQKDTEWALEQLTAIVDARVVELLPTIVTSNLTLELLAKGELECQRIASRLYQMCGQIVLSGDDYRRKIVRDRKAKREQRKERNEMPVKSTEIDPEALAYVKEYFKEE